MFFFDLNNKNLLDIIFIFINRIFSMHFINYNIFLYRTFGNLNLLLINNKFLYRTFGNLNLLLINNKFLYVVFRNHNLLLINNKFLEVVFRNHNLFCMVGYALLHAYWCILFSYLTVLIKQTKKNIWSI